MEEAGDPVAAVGAVQPSSPLHRQRVPQFLFQHLQERSGTAMSRAPRRRGLQWGEQPSIASHELGQDGEEMLRAAGPLTSLRAASRCFHSLSSMACSWSSRPSCLLSCSAKRCIFSLWERGGGNGKEGARGEVAGVWEAPRGGQFCSGPQYLHLLQLCQALSLLLLQLLQLLRLLLLLLLRLRLLPPLLLLHELRRGTARITLPFPKSHRLQLFGDFPHTLWWGTSLAPDRSLYLLGPLPLLGPISLLDLQVVLEEGQADFGIAALAFQQLSSLLRLLAPQIL